MHKEPSWSPILLRSPGMLRGLDSTCTQGTALAPASPWLGTHRARSPSALRHTPTSRSGGKLAAERCGKERAVAMETRCQTGRAATSFKTHCELV